MPPRSVRDAGKGAYFPIAVVIFDIVIAVFSPLPTGAATAVNLSPTASPASGQPGITVINLTGSGFPAGSIQPAAVAVSLKPAAAAIGGTAVTTPASAVITLAGSTRRVTFTIPASLAVKTPTLYAVSISGKTTTNIAFASSNTASLTVIPAASLSTVSPNSGNQGQTLSVTITGQYSNFVQGSTQASFGAGIATNSTTVTTATQATASITIAATATPGGRTVTMTTGLQVASLASGFTVAGQNPILTSLSTIPASPVAGQTFSLTAAGANFDPASAVILINGPGCSPCTVANATLTAKSAGSLTGPVTLGSGTFTAAVQNLASGAISGALPLAVGAVPVLTSLSTTPSSPLATQQFSLTLNGANFDPASATIVITGPGCGPCTVANPTLTAKSAVSVTGPVTLGSGTFTIALQNAATGATSGTLPLTVAAIPSLTSLSTNPALPVVTQQFSLTLSGANFDPASATIVITGPGCTPCTISNATLTAKSAASLTGPAILGNGSFTVAVQNVSTGAISGTLPLAVAPIPTLTSLSTVPATPTAAQPFSLTVSGANFVPASAFIVITGPGCAPCTVTNAVLTSKTAASLTGSTTIAGSGAFTVAVQNGAGGPTSGTLPLAVTAGPSITSFAPQSGTVGTIITSTVPTSAQPRRSPCRA
jgi:hypothetical protein